MAESQVFQSLWAQTAINCGRWPVVQDVGGRGGEPWLAVRAPYRTLVIQVLLLMHDNATAGHLGMQKTLANIRSRFYWVGQRKDVKEWCRRCTECASQKSPPAARGPMKVAVTGVPFQRVAMDIIGPFPKTAKGNMYVLIIGDYFTKWVEAYPMSDMEATTVAKCLYDFICHFGARLETAYHSARHHLEVESRRQKDVYDRSVRGSSFSIGDYVWLYCSAIPRGRSAKFHRPWKVKAHTSL